MRIASIALDYEGRVAPAGLDLATTREIGRLAIHESYRGRGQMVMAGLLLQMVAWCQRNEIRMLFSGSTKKLFEVYRRFNPSARLITSPRTILEDPLHTRYFENLRRYGGESCIYTFEVAGASPVAVATKSLKIRLGLK